MIRFLFCCSLIGLGFGQMRAQDTESEIDTVEEQIDTLLVGIKESPPFTYKDKTGRYIGIGVYLWEAIAKELNVEYIYKEMPLSDILKGLERKELDLAINPLTVTSQRILHMDFTQPFFISNSVIAIPKEKEKAAASVFKKILSLRFMGAILLLLFVIFLVGALVWVFERKKNDQFEENAAGIWSGIWWAAATMTTVGYGDKAPETFMGRMIGLVWMFGAILLISGMMASIASALTVTQLEDKWQDINDLRNVRTGTVKASASEVFLKDHFIRSVAFPSLDEGMQSLESGRVEAFVYDEPIIRYHLERDSMTNNIQILPFQFNTQYYSFATPKNSEWIDRINPVLLQYIETNRWKATLTDYGLQDM